VPRIHPPPSAVCKLICRRFRAESHLARKWTPQSLLIFILPPPRSTVTTRGRLSALNPRALSFRALDFSCFCRPVATMQPLKPHHSIASRAPRFLEFFLPSDESRTDVPMADTTGQSCPRRGLIGAGPRRGCQASPRSHSANERDGYDQSTAFQLRFHTLFLNCVSTVRSKWVSVSLSLEEKGPLLSARSTI
jgi:hypothetical protein